MGDENPIRTLGDYSKPSHEGYRNTIELPAGNNVVPLRSDTIRLVQNGCSFHGLRSEDPNQHLKDFLKLVDSLDLDGENRERTRLRSYYPIPCSILSTGKDRKTPQQYPDVPTTSWIISIRSMDLFQGHTPKSPSSWHQPLAPSPIFYDHVNPVTRRTIDHSAGDVPSTSDRHLIKLENQVQRLMEAHLAPTQPTQVNKITTSCEICSGPHDTQYCMENPEQAFVEYASSRTDEAGGKWYTFKPEQNNLGDTYNPSWKSHPNLSQSNLKGLVSNFMASQDARLSKFEADFKQQQSKMTNKIDTVLKAITDRIAGMLPSDMVKNLKLGTHPVSMRQPEIETKPPQPEEPEPTLEDEFQDLHLNLPVLEVLAHAPIYKTILDKYVESLELGKNGSTFVQGEILVKMKDPGLFTLPCRLGDSKPFDTLADLGSCVNIIPLYLFKKLNIRLLEETDHIFGLTDETKSYPVGIVKDIEVHIGKLKLLNDFYVIDMKKDPETPLLVRRGFLATANTVIDCRMAKIAVGEGITRSVFSVKGVDLGEEEAPYWTILGKRESYKLRPDLGEEEAPYWTTLGKRESYKLRPSSDGVGTQTPYYARKDFLDCHLPGEWEISRDAELNPFKDTLVFRRMDKPPKNGDGAWHAKIKLIDPDGEEFTKTLQSIPTTRKLSERESPREIIDLDHFYDT
ncbi:MAK10-like protein [Tanacetum coccineum]